MVRRSSRAQRVISPIEGRAGRRLFMRRRSVASSGLRRSHVDATRATGILDDGRSGSAACEPERLQKDHIERRKSGHVTGFAVAEVSDASNVPAAVGAAVDGDVGAAIAVVVGWYRD